jgi:putative phosphoesterase
MRIALVSDIHGNLVAFNAVLDDLARERIDLMVCLGDVAAFGPQPAEVVARLRDLGCPVVMGDTDTTLLSPEARATDETLRRLQEIDRWAAARLAPADRDYIGAFPSTLSFALDTNVSLLCYHGSPRSFKDRIHATTSADELEEMFAGVKARVYAGGHTHIQMLRRHGEAIVLNPGSVGLAYDRLPSPGAPVRNPPWGEYAILTTAGNRFGVDLRRVPFDVSALRQASRENGMPYAEWWCAEWDEA